MVYSVNIGTDPDQIRVVSVSSGSRMVNTKLRSDAWKLQFRRESSFVAPAKLDFSATGSVVGTETIGMLGALIYVRFMGPYVSVSSSSNL